PPAPPVPPDRRLLLTYYYYWYDATTGAHLTPEQILNNHLPATPQPTWRSIDWHRRQLSDMAYAGINVALPVYWGFDFPPDAWSMDGLPVLGQAWQALHAEGAAPPQLGLFLDTTIIRGRDLTTANGMAYFYANLRAYFSQIPREAWALVNGGPVVFLYMSNFAAAMNQATLDYAYAHFQADFGVRPYIVREVSWDYPILGRDSQGAPIIDSAHPIQTENNYLWGAAQHGYVERGGVAAVGPGYDDRNLPGRAGTVVDRAQGRFYATNFVAALRSGHPLLAIETWNEIHEASGICETVEYGRGYIELTRALAPYFHAVPSR
ncbi:MAG TPA: DUF5010 domain-containing protein, partial [Chloroflexota bacterium]|nr:DUF5010 domain-containing protein [Chloroflexota bacterium]